MSVSVAPPAAVLLAQRPAAGHLRRHDPQESLAGAGPERLVRLPFAHVPHVRHDARARLHREELRPQLEVEVRQQVQRHDRRPREVLGEDVAADDLDPVGDAGALGVARRELRELRVVLDADGRRAELARGGDRDASFARAQVVHDVARRRLRGVEHPQHHRVGRRQPHHVLAGLAQLRARRRRRRSARKSCAAATVRALRRARSSAPHASRRRRSRCRCQRNIHARAGGTDDFIAHRKSLS